MKLALSVEYGKDEQLIFAQQLGVDGVVVELEKWDAQTLKSARNRVEKTGLELMAVEGVPLAQVDLAVLEQAGIPLALCTGPAAAPLPKSPLLALRSESREDLSRLPDLRLDLRPEILSGATLYTTLGELAAGGGIALLSFAGPLDGSGLDVPQVLRALRRAGFSGPVRAIAPPALAGDTDWLPKGRARDLGFLRAALQALGGA